MTSDTLEMWLRRNYVVHTNDKGIECEVTSPDIHCLGCDALLYNFLVNGQLPMSMHVLDCEFCHVKNYVLSVDTELTDKYESKFTYRIKILHRQVSDIQYKIVPVDTGTDSKPKIFNMTEWLEN